MGDIDIMAETEIDGSIVSETLSVTDGLFLDRGTLTSHNDNWTNTSNLNRQSDATLFTGADWSNSRMKINNSYEIPMGEYCAEFTISDVTNGSGQCRFVVNDGTAKNIQLSDGHYRVENKADGKVYVYKDGVAQTGHVYDYSQSTIQFIFQITSSTSSFEFKDYILYPI